MHQPQLIFDRLTDLKQKAKEIKMMVKDALVALPGYVEATEKIRNIRETKKQIEQSVKQSLAVDITKLDDLQIDIAAEQELLNDASLTKLMKGETVEVEDQYGNKYEPEFKVKFKRL
jgi:hypothetical protein